MSTNSRTWSEQKTYSRDDPWEYARGASRGQTPVLEMAGRTRAIVRLEAANRVVTKGYQKGVYERVTKGIKGGTGSFVPALSD